MHALELSKPAVRRARIRERLPSDRPFALDGLEAALGAVPAPADLGSEELIGALAVAARLRNRIDAWLTSAAGEVDTRKLSRSAHAGTSGMLVAIATIANPAAGSAVVATARDLRTLPHVEAAFQAGRLSSLHVSALRDAAARIQGFGVLEEALVDLAATIEPAELRRLLSVLIGQCAPDVAEKDVATQREKRGVSLSETPNGMWRLDGWLDSVEGRRLAEALAAFTHRGGPEDVRTAKQRRADAIGDLAAAGCANARPTGVSGLSILVEIEDLPGGQGAELEDGHPLTPSQFELYSCAVACLVVFGTRRNGTFVPLAMGRSARRATAAQWAALVARDRGCIRCGRSPRFCEAHHIVHWKNGGLTDLTNLCLLCSRCHHDLHDGRYTIVVAAGVPAIEVCRGPP